MPDYNEIEVYTSRDLAVRQQENGLQAVQTAEGLIAAEQARAVAEVQAALVIAAGRPRNVKNSRARLIGDCQRSGLAKQALYQYSRGGTAVSGPSIRLAEAAARSWGNMTYGFRELARRPGESECEAYAWDLETNCKVVRQFVVRHTRDTKQGKKKLNDERDIYERIASDAQRRVRAAILEIIPGDIIEDAVEQCETTLNTEIGGDVSKAIRDLLKAFDALGVSRAQIEKRLGHTIDAIQPAQIIYFRKIWTSIRDGMSSADDWFEAEPVQKPSQTKPEPAAPSPKPEPEQKKEPKVEEKEEKEEKEVKKPNQTTNEGRKFTDAQKELLDTLVASIGEGDFTELEKWQKCEAILKETSKGKYGVDDVIGFNDTVCAYFVAIIKQNNQLKKK